MNPLSSIWYRLRLRKLSAAQKMASDCQKEASKLLGSLEKKKDRLEDLMAKFENQAAAVTSAIEQTKAQRNRYETALEALRNENEVLSSITIPALTAANKLILERTDADTAFQVRRQVAALPSQDKLD